MTAIKTLALALLLVAQSLSAATFTNPVAATGADPWVIQHDGTYYYCFSRGDVRTVFVSGAESLTSVFAAERVAAFTPPVGTDHSRELWAPELHRLRGAWYIYVAADDGRNENHRMHVWLREADDPRGPFDYLGKLNLPGNKWAIDGTTAEIGGSLYHIWSGWPGDVNGIQNLYICKLADPFTPVGERVMISTPELPWELLGEPKVNEGPTVFQHAGRTFLIYSASHSTTDHYCIGLLELIGDDPMKPASWKKHDRPWFAGGNGVISPGHASVTRSPDNTEWWLVYHSARFPGAGWKRQVNLQRFQFDPDSGLPAIGEPVSAGQRVPSPSGEKE